MASLLRLHPLGMRGRRFWIGSGMRALITGGTGFIGSCLALRLVAQGHAVRVLSLIRTPTEAANARRLVERGVDVLEGSVLDPDARLRALDGVQVVHHIAATMREADVPDRVFWETNVSATQHLFRASRTAGVRRFVYCSSMGVTGAIRGRRVDETAPYSPKDIYGETKAAAEAWVLAQARADGLATTAVRPGDVYGPGDRRLLRLFRMVQNGTFVHVGNGRGRRHMIYIEDLLDGLLAAQNHDAAVGEAFFLAGPATISLRDLVELIAAELGVRAPSRRVPYRPVRWLSVAVETMCRPLGVQPPIYPRRIDFFAHDYELDISKARRVLRFDPKVDVREGVRRTIAAYRTEGLLR